MGIFSKLFKKEEIIKHDNGIYEIPNSLKKEFSLKRGEKQVLMIKNISLLIKRLHDNYAYLRKHNKLLDKNIFSKINSYMDILKNDYMTNPEYYGSNHYREENITSSQVSIELEKFFNSKGSNDFKKYSLALHREPIPYETVNMYRNDQFQTIQSNLKMLNDILKEVCSSNFKNIGAVQYIFKTKSFSNVNKHQAHDIFVDCPVNILELYGMMINYVTNGVDTSGREDTKQKKYIPLYTKYINPNIGDFDLVKDIRKHGKEVLNVKGLSSQIDVRLQKGYFAVQHDIPIDNSYYIQSLPHFEEESKKIETELYSKDNEIISKLNENVEQLDLEGMEREYKNKHKEIFDKLELQRQRYKNELSDVDLEYQELRKSYNQELGELSTFLQGMR